MNSTPKEARLEPQGPGQPELCYFEWGDPSAQNTVLLVHATGFHARCWDRVVAELPGSDFHVFALDMRGHGRSEKVGPYDWKAFGGDLIYFAQRLNIKNAIGAGHSMGGHCMTQLAAALPEALARMVLIDPVIMAPEAYLQRQSELTLETHPVARRRNHYDSWQQMRDSLKRKGAYGLWRPDVLEDYCRYGLLPASSANESNGFDLACPAKVEASVYLSNTSTPVHELIPNINIPVTILRAPPRNADDTAMDFSKSPTWPELANCFPNAQDVLLEDLTHFIPMQDPVLVARYLLASK